MKKTGNGSKSGLLHRIGLRIKYRGLSTKMLNLLILSITIAIITTTTIAVLNNNAIMEEQNRYAVNQSLTSLKMSIETIKLEETLRAEKIVYNQQIRIGLFEHDTDAVAKAFQSITAVDSHIHQAIVDEKGTVLASNSTHYPVGQRIIDEPLVQQSLTGADKSMLSKNDNYPLAIFSAMPIVLDDKVVHGAVIRTYDLATTDVLDDLKASVNSDFTLFSGNTRINTTLTKDGSKIIGTTLNDKISDIVLTNKKEYVGESVILDDNFMTMYAPILSDDGQVLGILFAGNNLTLIERKVNNGFLLIFLFIVFAIVVVTIIGRSIITKAIRNPINHMIDIMEHIAKGEIDLNLKQKLKGIQSNDEIKHLSMSINSVINSIYDISCDVGTLKTAVEQKDLTVHVSSDKYSGIYKEIISTVSQLFQELTTIVNEIGVIADEIAVGASHSASASNTLAEGATSQATITAGLANSIQRISESSERNLDHTESANVAMSVTKQSIDESNNHMNDVIEAMDDINKKSREIGMIAKTIDDIAFQTNILALNAAIEAARAGQAGKGFAVVAEEVRSLANRSAVAAKNVSELIDKSSQAIDTCNKTTKLAGTFLKQAVIESNNALHVVDDIKHASRSQYESINEISQGTENINQVVQNNAAVAEETAASSSELAEQSNTLKQLVSEYKVV